MSPSSTIAVLCGFAAFTSAHMKMGNPPPYAVPALHNGPLLQDGSDFPCQITAGMTPSGGSATEMKLGSTQPLSFIGEATHGGGSCQVSLTYDFPPTKNSVFKVLHSIQGGCPAKNTAGNMGGDAAAADPFTYSFPVPDNIPACDNCTISWSWVNKIGNREFYHNCAPVKLTGTGGAKSNFDALPDMFVANIAPNAGCETVEGFDVLYPNPGTSVDNFGTNLSPKGLKGTCSSPAGGASAGSSGGAASSPASAPSSAPPSQASSPAAGNSPGVFATVPTDGAGAGAAESTPAAVSSATSAAAVPAAASATAASPPPPPPPPPAASPAAAAGSSGSGSGASSGSSGSSVAGAQKAGSACSTEGQFVCLGTSYQQCGSGIWTPVMALAAGTSCTAGTGGTLNIVATGGKTRRIAQRFHS